MTTTTHAECLVPGNHLMAGLLGTRDELLRQVEQAFPDEKIAVQGNRITVEGPDAADRLQSVGFPFPGVQLRIVGEDDRDVPVGGAGEIIVRSDSRFRGYWDDQAATLTTLRDEWCHTGDIGRLDHRGLLYLVDRKKDVIISGGENVYSPEVEDAVSGLDEVAACAVVGIPDQRWGEAVCAVVVPRSGATLTLDAVQEFVRGGLAGYKMPRRLVIVDELPVLASGKVDKKRLRAQLAGG